MSEPPAALDHCELSTYTELVDVIVNLRFLVREKRRRDRLSQRAVASELGLSPSTMVRFETHGRDLSAEAIVTIIKWLGDVK